MDLKGDDQLLLERLQELDSSLLVPPSRKEFNKAVVMEEEAPFVDLDVIYDLGGGCLHVYRWRCFFFFLVEFDLANGCTECGICANKMYCRCKDDGCEVNLCCEATNCECCVGKCVIL